MLIVNYLQSVAACTPFGSVRPKTCCLDTFGEKVLNGLRGHSTNVSVHSYSSNQYKGWHCAQWVFLFGFFYSEKQEKQWPLNEDKLNNLFCLICASADTKAPRRTLLNALRIFSVVFNSWSCETVECFWDGLILFQGSLWWWDLITFFKGALQNVHKVKTKFLHAPALDHEISILHLCFVHFSFLFTFMTDF